MHDVVLFDQEPSMVRLYARAFTPRPGRRGHSRDLPALSVEWRNLRAAPEKLKAYRKVCGLEDDGALPLTYPQVLAFGMQLALMTHRAFPLAPMGVIHQRNHMLERRAVGPEESVSLRCQIGEARVVKSGLEFDIATIMTAGDDPVWEGLSTYLSRGAYGEPDPPSPLAHMEDLASVSREAGWHVDTHTGRRYAHVTGDFNPIHVSTPLAWLFGFRRAIAHGMWCAARCLAELPGPPRDRPLRYDVAFKGPVFLGKTVKLRAATSGDCHRFDLFCQGNPRPVLKGVLRSEPSPVALVS